MKHSSLHIWILFWGFISVISACSAHKNTATTRWWKSFNTRYNVYYNGKMAYIEGSLEKERSHKDNFTELIPLYTVASKSTKEIGKGSFETAITKAQKAIRLHSINKKPEFTKQRKKTEQEKEWLSRKEYNPFLWKAWLLMGRSQFYKGSFDEAAATFSYMNRLYKTQPAIANRAQAWLAKCYIEQGWLYDAEEVIRAMQRDSVHWRAQKEWNYTLADYYIHTQDYKNAVLYLRKVIKTEMRRKQKAREWFLLGQLYEALNEPNNAYNAYKHVVKLNPPYDLAFNARIAMSEVMAQKQASGMISKLRRMALSDKNKNFKDRVYYALGNVFLLQKDTIKAINAYEQGRKESINSGVEKGVLMLKLGDLYWQQERYNKAKDCYTEAIGLLDKERKDYEQLSIRSRVLDQLVPFTNEVELQDSLQALVSMPEKERFDVIDKAIAAYKKKEKEEKRASQEAYAQTIQQENAGFQQETTPSFALQSNSNDGNLWYFYNPQVVNQGKNTFQRLWGRRENKDNWQRTNVTIVRIEDIKDDQEEAESEVMGANNSLSIEQEQPNKEMAVTPYQREYYLMQLPFAPEQMLESNKKRNNALLQAAIIFKDKLDNARLSERAFMRLLAQDTSSVHKPAIYYHLFLLYSRQKNTSLASSYLAKLKQEFPKHTFTKLLSNPYFAENAGLGVQIEDSLYAQAYTHFKANNSQKVIQQVEIAKERFPFGANKDKFLFIGALSKLNMGDLENCLADLQTLITNYPESKMSTFAGYIINGIKAGKSVQGGKFSLGEMWAERSALLNENDTTIKRQFVKDTEANFLFSVVYHPDSIDKNKLLYAIARYNFTTYPVRSFGIAVEPLATSEQMVVSGFHNYQEVLEYARGFYQQTAIISFLKHAETLLISEQNMELLGRYLSLKEYQQFYEKNFSSIKPLMNNRLTEPELVVIKQIIETSSNEISTETSIDNGTLFMPLEPEIAVPIRETIIPIEPEEPKTANNNFSTSGTIVTIEAETPTKVAPKAEVEKTNKAEKNAQKVPVNTQKEASKTQKNSATTPIKPTPQQQTTTTKTGIYFGDGFGDPRNNNSTNASKGAKTKEKRTDLDDDYYELEGF